MQPLAVECGVGMQFSSTLGCSQVLMADRWCGSYMSYISDINLMRCRIYILLLALTMPFWGAAQTFNYLPTSTTDVVVQHSYYTLSYSEKHEQAEWIAYELTKENTGGTKRRSNDFRPDPMITSGSSELADYKGSGYDRGHLAPAGDMKFDAKAMSESFYMSNMSPQKPGFNRGIWKNLEEQVREWAVLNEHLYIITGAILTEEPLATIGDNAVSVPASYYKVILDYRAPEVKAIAFVLANERGEEQLGNYVVTIDYVEKITGIDFFPELPDDLETLLESRKDLSRWRFKPLNFSNPHKASASEQCRAQAKSTGERCRNRTRNSNGYCHAHKNLNQRSGAMATPGKNATAMRCSASTLSGNRCKRMTKNTSGRCWQHP